MVKRQNNNGRDGNQEILGSREMVEELGKDKRVVNSVTGMGEGRKGKRDGE